MEDNLPLATKIFDKMEDWTQRAGFPFNRDRVIFCMDPDVEYDGVERTVKKSDIISIDQVESVLKSLFDSGPDWVHCNAIPMDDDYFLITLCSSAAVGFPRTSINLSYEDGRVAHVR